MKCSLAHQVVLALFLDVDKHTKVDSAYGLQALNNVMFRYLYSTGLGNLSERFDGQIVETIQQAEDRRRAAEQRLANAERRSTVLQLAITTSLYAATISQLFIRSAVLVRLISLRQDHLVLQATAKELETQWKGNQPPDEESRYVSDECLKLLELTRERQRTTARCREELERSKARRRALEETVEAALASSESNILLENFWVRTDLLTHL